NLDNISSKFEDEIFENCLNPLLLNENELSKLGILIQNNVIKFKSCEIVENKNIPNKEKIYNEGIDTNLEKIFKVMETAISIKGINAENSNSNNIDNSKIQWSEKSCFWMISPVVATCRIMQHDDVCYKKNGFYSYVHVGSS